MMTPTDPAWLLPGLALGAAHFHSLRRNTDLYLAGNAGVAVALHLARIAITVTALVLIARHGVWPLLFVMIGLLLARMAVIRARRMEAGRP